MKRVFIGVVCCLCFLNCAKNEEKNTRPNKAYIISEENSKTSEELKKKKNPSTSTNSGMANLWNKYFYNRYRFQYLLFSTKQNKYWMWHRI
jgi:hypothetical protein